MNPAGQAIRKRRRPVAVVWKDAGAVGYSPLRGGDVVGHGISMVTRSENDENEKRMRRKG
jgi:hypothetical protein